LGSLPIDGHDCLLNRPDVTLFDKANKERAFVDIPIPLTQSPSHSYRKAKRISRNGVFDIKQQQQLSKIIVIPLRLSAMGLNPNTLNRNLTNLCVPPQLPSHVQKMVVLNICSIVRKFLSDEVHLSDEERDKL
jgi:hypothetical protein